MKIDMHIHTCNSSDSSLKPDEIVKIAKMRGLQGVAIADHGTIKGGVETKKANMDEDFLVIVGSEVRTERGEIIGYFLNEEVKSKCPGEVIDEIKAQDGIVCIPHPFDLFRLSRLKGIEDVLDRVDLLEVFNARCLLNSANKKAERLAKAQKLAMSAGSDAHTRYEIGKAGIILDGGKDVREAILKNTRVFGKRSPPFVHLYSTFYKVVRH